MKLLKLIIDGLPLFRGELEFEFAAAQRVSEDNAENMYNIFGKIYQNNAIAVMGINASGKTSVLKALTFTMGMLQSSTPINALPGHEILDGLEFGREIVFKSYFYSAPGKIHYLRSVVRKNKGRYYIAEEELRSKAVTKSMTKKSVYDFDHVSAEMVRNAEEVYLLDDISIMVAFNKRTDDPIEFVDMLQHTDTNQLTILDDAPMEMITFFDPRIEYLHVRKKKQGMDIRLKFCNKDEIVVPSVADLNQYLSSGTIKGINTFVYAMRTFKNGGYLIVDELENHFNKEIVHTLVRFYRDKHINPHGAVLIFTTHYSELLDEFERNDNVYIVRNTDGITIQNMADVLRRNDIKKSEVYDSDFLKGTAPLYESYMSLKKMLLAQQTEG